MFKGELLQRTWRLRQRHLRLRPWLRRRQLLHSAPLPVLGRGDSLVLRRKSILELLGRSALLRVRVHVLVLLLT